MGFLNSHVIDLWLFVLLVVCIWESTITNLKVVVIRSVALQAELCQ